MTALTSGMGCAAGGFNPPSPGGHGGIAAVVPAVRRGPMKLVSFAGKWREVMAGWTTGAGWSLGMTGTPKAMLPF